MKEPLRVGKILVVVPTYNEKSNLLEVRRRVAKTLPKADLLFVDDNSPDGTGQLADTLAKGDKRVKVLHRAGKEGLGSAYVAGFQWALLRKYGRVVAMDADLSHDPAVIPKMIRFSSQYDIVIGSRYTSGGGMSNWGVERFAISRMANAFLKMLLQLHEADCTAGFKCYRTSFLRDVGLEKIFSPGYSFQVEILYRAHRMNAQVLEIPIMFENRHYGQSKLNFREVLLFFQTVLKLRWMAWRGQV